MSTRGMRSMLSLTLLPHRLVIGPRVRPNILAQRQHLLNDDVDITLHGQRIGLHRAKETNPTFIMECSVPFNPFWMHRCAFPY
jgi:hypothetical protein